MEGGLAHALGLQRVDFEPAGMDHATPGSSFTGGPLGSWRTSSASPRPAWFRLRLSSASRGVGRRCRRRPAVPRRRPTRSRSSRRRSCGGSTCAATPSRPSTSTSGPRSCGSTTNGTRSAARPPTPQERDAQVLAYERAISTATAGTLPRPAKIESFRLLSSVADITNGDSAQISRIVGASVDDLEPRLSRAWNWIREYGDRPTVRDDPDTARLAALTEDEQPVAGPAARPAAGQLDLEPTTSLVYGVPKLARGMGLDDPPTDEVKADREGVSSGCCTSLLVTPTAARGCPRSSSRSASDRALAAHAAVPRRRPARPCNSLFVRLLRRAQHRPG